MRQKITRRIFSTVAGLVVIGIGSATAQQPAPSVPAGNAKTGQALFMKIGCYQCHGNEGQGGAQGPRIGRTPMLAFRNFLNYIRAPRGEMPPYTAKVIAEKDVADIYAYLASLPSAPSVESIPLMQP